MMRSMRENICLALFVFIFADHRGAAFERTRHLAGDVQRVAGADGVRPQAGAGLGDVGDGRFVLGMAFSL